MEDKEKAELKNVLPKEKQLAEQFMQDDLIKLLFNISPVVFLSSKRLQGKYICKNIELANEFYSKFWKN